MDKYTVGQQLFYVPNKVRAEPTGYHVTITKIGRRWLQTDTYGIRLDKETLLADGGQYTAPGKAYLTYEEYAEIKEVANLWKQIMDIVRDYQKPKLSSKRLRDILTILRDEDVGTNTER